MRYQYESEESYYVHERVRSRSYSDTVHKESLANQYEEGVQSLREAFPNYQTDELERRVYESEIQKMQEELGYSPSSNIDMESMYPPEHLKTPGQDSEYSMNDLYGEQSVSEAENPNVSVAESKNYSMEQ